MKGKCYVHVPSGGVAEVVSAPGSGSVCYTLRWQTGVYQGREVKYTAALFEREFKPQATAESLGDGRNP